MSLKRLQQRVPSANPLGTYLLQAHELRFHKSGKDGSAKCDAFYTGDRSNEVIGVLYEIDISEKVVLDHAEGLGLGYEEKVISVSGVIGNIEKSVTYYAMKIDDSLTPYTWYKEHVLIGAREAKLPMEYISRIEAIIATEDPDTIREAEQRAIYTR